MSKRNGTNPPSEVHPCSLPRPLPRSTMLIVSGNVRSHRMSNYFWSASISKTWEDLPAICLLNFAFGGKGGTKPRSTYMLQINTFLMRVVTAQSSPTCPKRAALLRGAPPHLGPHRHATWPGPARPRPRLQVMMVAPMLLVLRSLACMNGGVSPAKFRIQRYLFFVWGDYATC